MRKGEGGSRHLCAGQGEGLNPADAPHCEAAIPAPPTPRCIHPRSKKKKKSGGEIALRFFNLKKGKQKNAASLLKETSLRRGGV